MVQATKEALFDIRDFSICGVWHLLGVLERTPYGYTGTPVFSHPHMDTVKIIKQGVLKGKCEGGIELIFY